MTAPFMEGLYRARQFQRQDRVDLLNAELGRGKLALEQAGEARAASRNRWLQEHGDYLERIKVLGRETNPFATLLGKYPGADASPFTGRAYEYDEQLARHPEQATQPAMPDPGQAPGDEGPRVPSVAEHRGAMIDEAYRRFGAEQSRMSVAEADLRKKLAGLNHPAKPPGAAKTTDLDIQLRANSAKKRQALDLIGGIERNKDGMIIGMVAPDQLERQRALGQRMLAQAEAEEHQLRAAYQMRGGQGPADLGPRAYLDFLQGQNVPEEQQVETLLKLYSPAELAAEGINLE